MSHVPVQLVACFPLTFRKKTGIVNLAAPEQLAVVHDQNQDVAA